jgi:hypothetical protein
MTKPGFITRRMIMLFSSESEESEQKRILKKYSLIRNNSCYCGHTSDCDCGDPGVYEFKNALITGSISEDMLATLLKKEMKLIKIDPEFYVVAEDSVIFSGDPVIEKSQFNPSKRKVLFPEESNLSSMQEKCLRITHSTILLDRGDISHLPLGKAIAFEEGIDVKKKIYELSQSECVVSDTGAAEKEALELGVISYTQALEDTKEKRYTKEDLRSMFFLGKQYGIYTSALLHNGHAPLDPKKQEENIEECISSLSIQKEWNITLDSEMNISPL